MRPLSPPFPRRAGGVALWCLPNDPALDSATRASRLLGVPVTRDANDRPRVERGDVSIAHAGGVWVLAATSKPWRIGVDIEPLRARPNALEIARAQFPEREAEALARLAEPARSEAFLRLWCAREAVMKALGTGLEGGFARVAFEWRRGAWRTPDWRLFSLSFKERAGVRMVLALARTVASAHTILTQPSP